MLHQVELSDANAELRLLEVFYHKIYKVFDDVQTLAEANVQTNDYLFIFELESVPSNPPQPEKKERKPE